MPNIVSLVPLSAAQASAIRAVDARVQLFEAGHWFADEYADTWPAAAVARYVSGRGHGSRQERDALLDQAEIVLIGFPFPLDIKARAPHLQWLHQTPAGASNLRRGDIWNSTVRVTTSRGYGETTAIAEYALAGFMHFAKSFDCAYANRTQNSFAHPAFAPRAVTSKTLCVIGAGGIGREIARLGKALGMRTVGTRATASTVTHDADFDHLAGPAALHALLHDSDYVAVSCQWTEATTALLDAAAFAALKPGAVLVNVARGEIIEEAALLAALDCGQVRGAVLDVFVGEFESLPPAQLWHHPRVIVTPHTSAHTDFAQRRAIELFCANLRCHFDGTHLENEIDWSSGY